MKSWLALFLSAQLCLGIAACGDTGKSQPSTSQAKLSASGESLATTGSITTSTEGLLNDGDTEKKKDGDGDNSRANHEDTDGDSADEYETTYDNGNYHDSDDGLILSYGHSASASDTRAIAAIVERYYSAAATGNGAQACSMMVPAFGAAVAEDYGRGSAGPSYLRGATTCRAVMSLLFEHLHANLAGALAVTGVRVKGDTAYAFIGSRTMPASYIVAQRGVSGWKFTALLGEALP
jgi:hypothetical protein